MGLGLREVAADVVCTLGMEEDEGKIDALAGAETKVGSCMATDRSKGRAPSSIGTGRWPRAARRRPPPSSTIAEVEGEEEASGFRGCR